MDPDKQLQLDMRYTEVTCSCGHVHKREWYLVDPSRQSARQIEYYTRCNQCHNKMLLRLDTEEDLGFPVGAGWKALVLDLHAKLTAECPDYKIEQVKEKFGGLRYYVSGATSEAQSLIDEAEALSYTICEQCSKPGKPRNAGWVSTLCDDCNSEPL